MVSKPAGVGQFPQLGTDLRDSAWRVCWKASTKLWWARRVDHAQLMERSSAPAGLAFRISNGRQPSGCPAGSLQQSCAALTKLGEPSGSIARTGWKGAPPSRVVRLPSTLAGLANWSSTVSAVCRNKRVFIDRCPAGLRRGCDVEGRLRVYARLSLFGLSHLQEGAGAQDGRATS